MKPLRILMLVANAERRRELLALLGSADHHVEAVPDAEAAAQSLREPGFDTLLIELDAPGVDVGALREAMTRSSPVEPESLDAAERRHLAQVLRHTAGNKRKAAQLLGISRSTLLNKVRKYGIAPLVLLATSALAAGNPLAAQLRGPIPDGEVTSGKLSFDGRATVGDFVGATTTVSGRLLGAADISQVRGWVQAPVRTLTTGNGRRDRDLNKSMESNKYPEMRFDLTGVTPRGGDADSMAATLQGKLLIHGVTRTVSLPATIWVSGSEARVRTDFPLSLRDYDIKGLSKMLGILKMYDDIEVHVDLVFELGAGSWELGARS